MADQFDAIVIGSGFGGSVAAYEFARAQRSVCVLERGQPWKPGAFPRNPYRTSRNFWDPSEGYYGLFDLWSFAGTEAIVASGLGGGSLIYANVLLRKPEKWFVREEPGRDGYEHWPISRADLDPHYADVERILGATPFPHDRAPYDATAKTQAFKRAAQRLGLEWSCPPLAVTFAASDGTLEPARMLDLPYPNLHGVQRSTCRLCGECDLGCNYGSKNTLDLTYLSLAANTGYADIRTLCEVRTIEPVADSRYRVGYVEHDLEREGQRFRTRDLKLSYVTARHVVFAAGSLGSTYLLLQNRERLGITGPVGDRFCTNGDLLAFAFDCRDRSGSPRAWHRLEAGYGTVITSMIRGGDELDGAGDRGRGFLVQDAGYPDFINWMIEAFQAPAGFTRFLRFAKRWWFERWTGEPETEISARAADLLGSCATSAGSLPLLGMGRDVADGRMKLRPTRNGKKILDVDWRNVRSKPYFDRLRATCRKIAEELGGTYRESPTLKSFNRLVTVHPLGGCPMGRDHREGVVDGWGRVFGRPGLLVVDGSALPGPVGVNPSLTIAAFARRAVQRALDD